MMVNGNGKMFRMNPDKEKRLREIIAQSQSESTRDAPYFHLFKVQGHTLTTTKLRPPPPPTLF